MQLSAQILFGSAHLRQDGVQQLLVVPALILILIIVGVAAQRVLEGLDIRLEVELHAGVLQSLGGGLVVGGDGVKAVLGSCLGLFLQDLLYGGVQAFQVLALAAMVQPIHM